MFWLFCSVTVLVCGGLMAWALHLWHQQRLDELSARNRIRIQEAETASKMFDKDHTLSTTRVTLEAEAVANHAAYKLRQVELAKSALEQMTRYGTIVDRLPDTTVVELFEAVRRQLDNEQPPKGARGPRQINDLAERTAS